ncbi:MAG: chemotaxis protein CheA [Clostridia bacterium]|jgi:two-component system chemotaxis sensor kinase CheA|nr:chemotaxis protein CheA [Clostridia bacterium]
MDMNQYLEIFIDESNDHLQNLNESLLELEKNPNNSDILNEIFRVAHTLKGMAGTMGYTKMQKLTHDMENVLSEIRNGNISVSAKMLDVLFKCLDALESYVEKITNSGSEGDNAYDEIVEALNNILEGKEDNTTDSKEEVSTNETVVESEIEYSATEILAIKEAVSEDMKALEITVRLSEKCVLKSARAFLVFKALEDLGETIKTMPKTDDIEEEKFDFEFKVVLLTKEEKDLVKEKISNVSEVESVEANEVDADSLSAMQTVNAQNTGEVKEEQKVEEVKKEEKSKPKAGKTVRVDINRLDNLMNLVSELIIIKTRLEGIGATKASKSAQNYNEAIEYLERITTNLHDAVMKVRMVPVERVFNRFPRLIRDLARKLDKNFELYMSGEETELDRTVIDEIGDPLIHLLRNAADHGIESKEERAAAGKDEKASIFLRAYQDGNNVVIEVEDDGAGINVETIKAKAIEKGVVTQDIADNMSDNDIIELLFRPSFSMAKQVTDLSGRGVGLDVVKSKIEALGGHIEVRTVEGKGSKFIIRLPLTLAIIQSLMVKLGNEQYAIPLNTIETIEDIKLDEIKYVQKQEVILLRDKVIPIVHLDGILDVAREEARDEYVTVVIVKKGEKEAGFIVDSLIGQQEIVIKSLGKYLSQIKMIAGATILGDGEVALILDVNTLVK